MITSELNIIRHVGDESQLGTGREGWEGQEGWEDLLDQKEYYGVKRVKAYGGMKRITLGVMNTGYLFWPIDKSHGV